MSRVSVVQGVMMALTRQVDVYSPEPDTWGDGSWPSLRRMRLSHGCCVAPSDHGGVIITGGGSAEVSTTILIVFSKFLSRLEGRVTGTWRVWSPGCRVSVTAPCAAPPTTSSGRLSPTRWQPPGQPCAIVLLFYVNTLSFVAQ